MRTKQTKSQGFTIIEVLIVLAIAGLILLIVLLAIPALQRNARNTALRNDAAKSASLLQEVINNNNGTVPTGTTEPTVMNTTNGKYSRASTISYSGDTTFLALPGSLAEDTLYIRAASACGTLAGNTGSQSVVNASARSVSITFMVESPGTTVGTGATGKNAAGFTNQCVDGN